MRVVYFWTSRHTTTYRCLILLIVRMSIWRSETSKMNCLDHQNEAVMDPASHHIMIVEWWGTNWPPSWGYLLCSTEHMPWTTGPELTTPIWRVSTQINSPSVGGIRDNTLHFSREDRPKWTCIRKLMSVCLIWGRMFASHEGQTMRPLKGLTGR